MSKPLYLILKKKKNIEDFLLFQYFFLSILEYCQFCSGLDLNCKYIKFSYLKPLCSYNLLNCSLLHFPKKNISLNITRILINDINQIVQYRIRKSTETINLLINLNVIFLVAETKEKVSLTYT